MERRIIAVGPCASDLEGVEVFAGVSEALDAARSPDVLGVVALPGLGVAEARRLVESVKQESLSTVVVCLDSRLSTTGFRHLPDAMLPPRCMDHLAECVGRLVHTDRGGGALVDAVQHAVGACLASMHAGYEVSRSWARTTNLLPGERHGMLSWGGEDSSGWLTVSSTDHTIARLMRGEAASGGFTVRALDDAVAELANQMLGAFKRELLLRGVTIELGLPVSFAGTRPPFSYQRAPSTLMVELHGPDGDAVWVDVAVSAMPELGEAEVVDADDTELGELMFL